MALEDARLASRSASGAVDAGDQEVALAGQRIALLEDRLGRLAVRAPFDGAFALLPGGSGRLPEVGEVLTPGAPVGALLDLNELQLVCDVHVDDAASLHLGARAVAAPAGRPGLLLEGQVTSVGVRVEPRTRTVRVEARVAAPAEGVAALADGAFCRASITGRPLRDALHLDAEWLGFRGGAPVAFVVEADDAGIPRARLVPLDLEPGEVAGGRVVRAGLRPGQQVVTGPLELVGDGVEVVLAAPIAGWRAMIRGLARLAVSNPVGANLLMIAMAVGGLVSYAGMPREVFPNFSLDAIEILTALPGAAPVDVERLVTTPIEDALDGLDGVKEMRSTSREGVSRIKLTLTPDAEPVEVLAGARDRVRGGGLVLPEDAEEPFVHEVENQFPVIAVFVYGSADPLTLKRLAEDEARGLEALPGVANVQSTGLIEPRLWVEVDPDALERHGLTFADVERAVAMRVAEAPLGALVSEQKERLLRIGGDVQWARDLASVPVRVSSTGAEVRLDRLAEVTESEQRGSSRGRFNGWPCVHMQVLKGASGDTIDIAREVHEYVASRAGEMPPGSASARTATSRSTSRTACGPCSTRARSARSWSWSRCCSS